MAALASVAVGCGSFPNQLWETGLFLQGDPDAISSDVIAFSPRFQLWSDGAEKKRWLKLPVGQQIDTSDGDHWIFPEGTQLWKEFSKDGLRIETRLVEKRGPESGDWAGVAYAWNDEETEAVKVRFAGEQDARCTTHDIPQRWMCAACHEGAVEWPLGISAVQLSSGGDATGLQALLDANAFTQAPPTLTVPGDDATQAAIGYLHSNCGACHHNDVVESFNIFGVTAPEDFSLQLLPSELTGLEHTGVYRTAVDQALRDEFDGATERIAPGDAENSGVVERMSVLGGEAGRMPLVGSETLDKAGLAAVTAWIDALPVD
jgi:hypothetical protein